MSVKGKGGRRPHGTVLVYEGRRYTWSSKGYWRCTTKGDRHNLARHVWEERRGPIPPGHKVIYLDGDRFNVRIENLACLSHSDVQKRRMKDPEYKAVASCYSTYGRLLWTIQNRLNPSLGSERSRKAWDTRRRRFGPSGGNARGASFRKERA